MLLYALCAASFIGDGIELPGSLLPTLAEELERQTGFEHAVDDALADTAIIVSSADLTAQELRAAVAEAISGVWVEKDDGFVLLRPDDMAERLAASDRAARRPAADALLVGLDTHLMESGEFVEALLDAQQAIQSGVYPASWQVGGEIRPQIGEPSSALLAQCLVELGSERLLSIQPGTAIAFATHPNSLQSDLPRPIYASVNRYVSWLGQFRSDAPQVENPNADIKQSIDTHSTWAKRATESAKAVLLVRRMEPSQYSTQLGVFNEDGDLIGLASRTMSFDRKIVRDQHTATPPTAISPAIAQGLAAFDAELFARLTPDSGLFAARLATVLASGDDLQSLAIGPLLIDAAKRAGYNNVVAAFPDQCLSALTASALEEEIELAIMLGALEPWITVTKSDTLLLIKPESQWEAERTRIHPTSARNLLNEVRKNNSVTLAAYANASYDSDYKSNIAPLIELVRSAYGLPWELRTFNVDGLTINMIGASDRLMRGQPCTMRFLLSESPTTFRSWLNTSLNPFSGMVPANDLTLQNVGSELALSPNLDAINVRIAASNGAAIRPAGSDYFVQAGSDPEFLSSFSVSGGPDPAGTRWEIGDRAEYRLYVGEDIFRRPILGPPPSNYKTVPFSELPEAVRVALIGPL